MRIDPFMLARRWVSSRAISDRRACVASSMRICFGPTTMNVAPHERQRRRSRARRRQAARNCECDLRLHYRPVDARLTPASP